MQSLIPLAQLLGGACLAYAMAVVVVARELGARWAWLGWVAVAGLGTGTLAIMLLRLAPDALPVTRVVAAMATIVALPTAGATAVAVEYAGRTLAGGHLRAAAVALAVMLVALPLAAVFAWHTIAAAVIR
jgi:hypothetical protein